MSKTYGYLRTSTDKQDLDNQRLAVWDYAHRHKMQVDDFIEAVVSSRRSLSDRKIEEIYQRLQAGDTLIVSELSRLGRSTREVLNVIHEIAQRKIRLIIIKQNLDLNGSQDMTGKVMLAVFSLLAELERDLISLRTKEALAAKKKKGIVLGKPKGTIQKSKFDKDRKKIEELLSYGVSVRKIAEVLSYPTHRGLNTYINTRGLKKKPG